MIVGTSYNLQHRAADVQRSVNLYAVTVELPGGKSVAYLDSVPGLREWGRSPAAAGALLQETGDYLLQQGGGLIMLEGSPVAPPPPPPPPASGNDLLLNGAPLLLDGDPLHFTE